jgi:Rrf2 family transcriptional regulator, nitric oxide-sensitive transcriptional repressor
MLLLNRTHLALRILIHVGKSDDAVLTVQRIAEDLSIPPQYAAKIVHELVRAGFLQSIRGRLGGVKLARPARDIRVGDVVMSVEPLKPPKGRPKKNSEIEHFFDESMAKFVEVLNFQTIEDFLPGRAPRRSLSKPTPARSQSGKQSQQR